MTCVVILRSGARCSRTGDGPHGMCTTHEDTVQASSKGTRASGHDGIYRSPPDGRGPALTARA